jgi:hypothetical protein
VVVVEGPWTAEAGPELAFSYRPTETSGGIPAELLWTAGGIAVALAALVVGFAVFRRRGTEEGGAAVPDPDLGDGPAPPGSEPDGSTATGASDQAPVRVDDGPEAAGEDGGTDSDGGDDGVDVSLLSDEERVEHLLREAGGRMKQATIVKETGWSDAKVSQLLSSMAEEGRVNKLRLGRENLISLPDEDESDGAETEGD